jgi:putative phosphoesterase
MILGVISDTHGLLRPEAVAALRGADRIVHAGDVGSPEILASLAALAPLTAVRGNNDETPVLCKSKALSTPATDDQRYVNLSGVSARTCGVSQDALA